MRVAHRLWILVLTLCAATAACSDDEAEDDDGATQCQSKDDCAEITCPNSTVSGKGCIGGKCMTEEDLCGAGSGGSSSSTSGSTGGSSTGGSDAGGGGAGGGGGA
jgi:uncharacterized membrane protein YgcG